MPWEQISFEQELVNRIRSRLKTLDGAVKTSMKMRNRITGSVYQLAQAYDEEITGILQYDEDNKELKRWAAKFDNFCLQYGLYDDRPVE